MQSPFYNLVRRKPTNENLPFEGLYCGCTAILPDQESFKDHLLGQHQAHFVKDSSHYLSKLSNIVMPVRCWNVQMMKTSTQLEQLDDENDSDGAMAQLVHSPISNESIKSGPRKRKSANRRKKRMEKSVTKPNQEKKEMSRVYPQIQTKLSQKSIEWNGFVLVPNESCQKLNYFRCGLCNSSFEHPDSFIAHCFDECKLLEHHKSSHFIRLSERRSSSQRTKSESITMLNMEAIPQLENIDKKQQKLLMKEQFDEIQRLIPQVKITPLNRQKILPFGCYLTHTISEQTKGVYQFFIENYNSQEVFMCGCGSSFSRNKAQIIHIQTQHSQIIPRNSSHIFLSKDAPRRRNLLKVHGQDDGRPWFCPCRLGVSMTRQKFISHIIYIHKGVSPVYKSEHFRENS